MARNQDRQFSESDSLRALDLGGRDENTAPRELPRGDEPEQPAPARREGREKRPAPPPEADPATIADPAQTSDPAPKEAEAAVPEEAEALQEEKPSVPEEAESAPAQDDAQREQNARQAWNQEARRVDGEHPGLARDAWAAEDAAAGRGKKQPPQGAEKPEKRGRKKKKKKKKTDERQSFIKTLVIVCVCAFLFLSVALMVVSNFVSSPLLALPRKAVTAIITPVQRVFAQVTGSVVDYLRMLKIRGNLEYEYEQLSLKLDEYANQSAQLEELRRINESLYDQLDEQQRNRDLNPLAATVIGTDSGNYFSTLTLDVGSDNGVEAYMAVVAQGGLVGVTYNVEKNKCQVRCIIDSDCTVAALIQSTRDQGSVKGTLGINGEPMCRMYYLPDNALSRPGDMVVTSGVGLEFPKGIPIGEVRESTRGMEDNKSYVVLEPIVNFQHLEYVTVYRYKPAYAEAAQSRSSGFSATLEPLSTPRPVPTFQAEGVSDFMAFTTQTPAPGTEPTDTPAPEAAPTDTPAPNDEPTPIPTDRPENLTYRAPEDPDATQEPTPRPTFTPSPSPTPTMDPGKMTVEDEE